MHIAPGLNWIHPKAKRTHATTIDSSGNTLIVHDDMYKKQQADSVANRIQEIINSGESIPDDFFTMQHPTYVNHRTVFVRSIHTSTDSQNYMQSLLDNPYIKQWLLSNGITEEDIHILKLYKPTTNSVDSVIENVFVNCINTVESGDYGCVRSDYDFKHLYSNYKIGRIGYFADNHQVIRTSPDWANNSSVSLYILKKWIDLLESVFLDCIETDKPQIWRSVLDKFLRYQNFDIEYTSRTGISKTVTFHVVE